MFVFGSSFKDHTLATCQTEISADRFEIIHIRSSCTPVFVIPRSSGKIYNILEQGIHS